MKQSLISYLFPISLCILIVISTFILNVVTDIDIPEIKKYSSIEHIAIFSNTSIFHYNQYGNIEHKIYAKQIEQLANNKYILHDANINQYNNNLNIRSFASNVIYNPITGDIFLNETNNSNKVKIILNNNKKK